MRDEDMGRKSSVLAWRGIQVRSPTPPFPVVAVGHHQSKSIGHMHLLLHSPKLAYNVMVTF